MNDDYADLIPPSPTPARKPAGLSLVAVSVLCLVLGAGGTLLVEHGGLRLPSVVSGPTITATGSGVLIVHDNQSDTTATSGQIAAMNSQADDSLRAFVTSKGGVFRVLDKDDSVDQDLPAIQAAWKLPRTSDRWLIVWKDGRCSSDALPEKEADSLAIAKKRLGN